jgi:hypothetical protein
MLIGDKSKFAIEWKIRMVIENKKHFHFRMWSQNKIIGDFEDDVMDSIACGYIKIFLKNEEERYSYDFNGMNIDSIYRIIYNEFFETYEKNKITEQLLQKKIDFRSVFHLDDIGGSSFDNFNIFCCKMSDNQVLIWKNISTNELNETQLPIGYIENIMTEFLKLETIK